jgi:multicomponent Na+:H+ antiporter subunit B
MSRAGLGLLAVALLGVVFARVLGAHVEAESLRALAATYVHLSPEALTTPNVVTGILLAYRGFDTLGEVAVLFMVAASLGPLLKPIGADDRATAFMPTQPGEIVETGKVFILPIILIFGAYVVLNGHLSAGGGFQGGAIVASGVMLLLIANPGTPLNVAALSVAESGAGVLFVVLGILGMILAGGFLDPRFLPQGQLGAFLSAGAIPLISALLGIKVAAELGVVLDRFRS